MTEFRFLLDENLEPAYRTTLRRALPDVRIWAIGDPGAPPRGTPDPELLEWCEASGFILVTKNRSSMPSHLAAHLASGRHMPGVFALHPTMSLRDVVSDVGDHE